ncbi:aldehyde dehydrogenase [Lederbergia wuyishanensis]|uniref:Aldehyde dehydrogenase n=1 Tax=Lederbergia wuyishanensis TaxID=1347903 RepID=A0ABU0D4A4_9BACI|nr:aldehyde dehydrogenase [Lederbergia wuyishanensis]MCJ8008195.1 aldehyde dehydrogenase [Lederbergia wuyishanensis]MDQ0343216.1 aldehyde dehydrogenase (NAD+) [Lederbergia wuyishanensis]
MGNFKTLVDKQNKFFHSGTTKSISYRLAALQKLRNGIKAHEKQLMDALKADLNKSEFESYTSEIGIVLEEIRFIQKHLRSWSKPKRVKTPITHVGSKSYIYPEPYGVVLIIAPWNYPFQLAVAPLIGAIASGNCAIIKPSELTPKTSAVFGNMIGEIFSEEYVSVVQGGIETSEALLAEKFDYIFFTGSVSVGKIIMEAAAKHVTPVTLELGGKSPCIVHEDADIKLAAKRIAWGKFMNAGQTCVAPDYLYVHKNIRDVFLHQLGLAIRELYGEKPLKNPNFTHIVSKRHFQRLESFLQDGEIIFGGEKDEENLVIEPTVVMNITWNDPIMMDEIFGPILPVLEYQKLSNVIEGIQQHPNPLALYLFTKNEQLQDEVITGISFGGGCINDTVYHLASPYLPFGGVGSSGVGAYHGKGSFDTFSHHKSILKQTTRFDLPFRYPNMKNGLNIIKHFIK